MPFSRMPAARAHPLENTLLAVPTLALGPNYLVRSSLGPPSFPALADRDDLAVNLAEVGLVIGGYFY